MQQQKLPRAYLERFGAELQWHDFQILDQESPEHGQIALLIISFSAKLIMRRHGLRGLRRLLTNTEEVEYLTMMPPQFGAESLQLRPLQLLLLHMSTLEIWMPSAKFVTRSGSWPNERSEVRGQYNLL